MNETEIRERVTSDSLPVLQQALNILSEMLSEERSREARAEGRATAVLAVAGILTGFVVSLAATFDESKNIEQWTLMGLYVLYFGSISFLLKGGIYGIWATKGLSGYRVTPDLAFDLQPMTEVEALREELIWKIWEYYRLLPLANKRLLFTERGQRSVIASVICFAVLGFIRLIPDEVSFTTPSWVVFVIGIVMMVLLLSLDRIAERSGNLWETSKTSTGADTEIGSAEGIDNSSLPNLKQDGGDTI